MAASDTSQDYTKWIQDNEIDDATRDLLKDNGVVSLRGARLLTPAHLQKHFAKALNLGQNLLLQQAVEQLQPTQLPSGAGQPAASTSPPHHADGTAAAPAAGPSKAPVDPPGQPAPPAASASPSLPLRPATMATAGATPSQPADQLPSALAGPGLDAATLMQILGHSGASTNSQQDSEGKPLVFDPFNCGRGAPCKLYDIRDFITLLAEKNPKTSVRVGDVELTLPDSRPKLETVTPLQYMEAAIRIAREMVDKDGADLQRIMDYLGYVVKVANMGQRFQWKSVLNYDREYRRVQAESGFPFGADNSYMMQLFLRDRDQATAYGHAPAKPALGSTHPQTKYDPSSGKPICGRYNTPQSCQLRNCRFAHVCRSCFGGHSDMVHNQQPPPAPKNNM
jgi:hypothetical protein